MKKLKKHPDNTFSDCSDWSVCFLYDDYGVYKGQRQPNMLDDEPGQGPDYFFFKTSGNEAGLYSLTEEEMANAEKVYTPNPLIEYLEK